MSVILYQRPEILWNIDSVLLRGIDLLNDVGAEEYKVKHTVPTEEFTGLAPEDIAEYFIQYTHTHNATKDNCWWIAEGDFLFIEERKEGWIFIKMDNIRDNITGYKVIKAWPKLAIVKINVER